VLFNWLESLSAAILARGYTIGCLGSRRSLCNSKKSIIWFIMISPAKFQPPNPSITASKCIPRFWSFGRFVWKSKKLPNFFIFEKLFTFLFWISMRKLFNYDQNINSLAFSCILSLITYKIADEFSKNSIFIQTKNKLDENSTWRTLKYPNHEIQNKKVKNFRK
jgi:hypothetical protein